LPQLQSCSSELKEAKAKALDQNEVVHRVADGRALTNQQQAKPSTCDADLQKTIQMYDSALGKAEKLQADLRELNAQRSRREDDLQSKLLQCEALVGLSD
jgi:hypothetical protein